LPQRHSGLVAFTPQKEPLAAEEVAALSGIWRTSLCLDDGDHDFSLHLKESGAVQTSDQSSLPFNICQGTTWKSARWSVSAVPELDSAVSIRLQLGILYLEGKGERKGLRCVSLKGSVLEGRDDPCCVGSFELSLALPTNDDVSALMLRHLARREARPAPPLSFKLASFIGRWGLMITLDDALMPSYFSLRLNGNRTFISEGGSQVLAGTWGLYSKGYYNRPDGGAKGSAIMPYGSSVWLKVNREICTETLRGIADLPEVRESFHLWGVPILESVESELAARTGEGSSDRVDGRLWVGAVERAYFGRFSLLRTRDDDGDHDDGGQWVMDA